MRGVRVLFVGRAVGDMAIYDDEGRAVSGLHREFNGVGEQIKIVGVAHAGNVPAVALEARHHIFAEGPLRGTI